MLLSALCAAALAADPLLDVEMEGEPAEVLAAWQQALEGREIDHRGSIETLLAEDHPALPTVARFSFSGHALLGLSGPDVNGEVEVERVGAGRSAVRLSYIPSANPRDNAKLPKLSAKLLREAEALLDGTRGPPAPIVADPVLADPEACGPRLDAFFASPIPGARQTVLLSLPELAAPCQRRAVQELVTDAHGKETVTAWLLESYAALPDAQKGSLIPLVLAVPEPDDALLDLIEREEERWMKDPAAGE